MCTAYEIHRRPCDGLYALRRIDIASSGVATPSPALLTGATVEEVRMGVPRNGSRRLVCTVGEGGGELWV